MGKWETAAGIATAPTVTQKTNAWFTGKLMYGFSTKPGALNDGEILFSSTQLFCGLELV
jgi:hypothetical protein